MTELRLNLAGVTLREITEVNRAEVEQLRVTADQETFVDGVVLSIAEAAANPTSNPWYRAIYRDEIPLGFVMIAEDVPAHDADIRWRYYL